MGDAVRLVAGADVARGSWVVVTLADGVFHDAMVVEGLETVWDSADGLELLAADIPIGLPEDGGAWPRAADLEARRLVGPRWSSVFPTPPRPVLDARSYTAANALHRELTEKGLSRQTWGLRGKILEAEGLIDRQPGTIEAHPEVCFRMMKGAPLEHAKKSWNGQMERRRLLEERGIVIPDGLDAVTGRTPPDDLLDAAATAWTAWRFATGKAAALPAGHASPSMVERGLIWF
jgi:predicted RNase H-like nuclease